MTPQHEAAFSSTDILALFSKYRDLLIWGALASSALFLAAAYMLPYKYKSHFVMTINAKYFQSPLIRDFVPELTDPSEMRFQRESLIRQTLTPAFLDSMGDKYGIYQNTSGPRHEPEWIRSLSSRFKTAGQKYGFYHPASPEADRSAAREDLMQRIQIVDMNNTTFQVSFLYSNPEVTLQVTKDIYAQVSQMLFETRNNNLVTIRDAIRKRLESLAFHMTSTPDERASSQPLFIRDELRNVQSQIRALLTQYSEDHPAIKRLRERESALARWQELAANQPDISAEQRNSMDGVASQDAVHDIYNDLMKKLNYLNIALESDKSQQGDYFAVVETPQYPSAPLWPKKGLFLLWGFAVGLFGALFIAVLREYFEKATLRAETLADRMGLPLLGSMPTVSWNAPIHSLVMLKSATALNGNTP